MDRDSHNGTPAPRRTEMSWMVVNAIRDAMADFLDSQPLDAHRRQTLWEQFHGELTSALPGPPSSSRDGSSRPTAEHPMDSTLVNRAVHGVALALGADAIGVELGKHVRWGAMGFLDAITFASENLAAAFALIAKHYGSLTSTVTLRCESRVHVPARGGAPTTFAYVIQEQRSADDDITHIVDFVFGLCLARSRVAVAGALELEAVKLRRKGSPSSVRMHHAFFGVFPEYEASENAFVFARSMFAMPLRNPYPTLVDVIEANASRFAPSSGKSTVWPHPAPRLVDPPINVRDMRGTLNTLNTEDTGTPRERQGAVESHLTRTQSNAVPAVPARDARASGTMQLCLTDQDEALP